MLVNTKQTLAGKSLIINSVLIAVNLLGMSFLVMGYHPHFEESAALYKWLGYGIMGLSLAAIFILEGMALFAYVARVIVGGLFIVSGLIKANDPKGFAYKLEEYFEDGALAYRIKGWLNWETFSLEYLIQYALIISIILLILEIVLGAMVLLGVKFRASSWLLLVLMVFFTFLTWHTKECDPTATFHDVDTYAITSAAATSKIAESEFNENVTIVKQTEESVTIREVKRTQCVEDCGCFGDAMKGSIGRSLTPAESYWKDIVLLYLVVVLFYSQRKIGINNAKENIAFIVLGLLFITFFSFIFSWYFPVLFGAISLILALWAKRLGRKDTNNEWGMIGVLFLLCFIFITYVLLFLPLKDYRPYHVGSNLIERMHDGKEGIYESVFTYTNLQTGKDTLLTNLDKSTEAIWGDAEQWEFKEKTTKTIKAAILPSIQQFEPGIDVGDLGETEKQFAPINEILQNNVVEYVSIINKETGETEEMSAEDFEFFGEDYDTAFYKFEIIFKLDENFTSINLKDYILSQEQILIVFGRQLEKANFNRIDKLKEIADSARHYGIPMLMITADSKQKIDDFREKTGLLIPTLQNDDIEIKAITRSDPTLMLLKQGVVVGKYPYRSTPSWKWLIDNVLNTEN